MMAAQALEDEKKAQQEKYEREKIAQQIRKVSRAE